jgi:hypothetical protein
MGGHLENICFGFCYSIEECKIGMGDSTNRIYIDESILRKEKDLIFTMCRRVEVDCLTVQVTGLCSQTESEYDQEN